MDVILQIQRCFIFLKHYSLRLLLHHSHIELRLEQASDVGRGLCAVVADVGQCKRVRLKRYICLAQRLLEVTHFML